VQIELRKRRMPPPATVPVSRLEDILAALDDARRDR
jgi:hypothetical protein